MRAAGKLMEAMDHRNQLPQIDPHALQEQDASAVHPDRRPTSAGVPQDFLDAIDGLRKRLPDPAGVRKGDHSRWDELPLVQPFKDRQDCRQSDRGLEQRCSKLLSVLVDLPGEPEFLLTSDQRNPGDLAEIHAKRVPVMTFSPVVRQDIGHFFGPLEES